MNCFARVCLKTRGSGCDYPQVLSCPASLLPSRGWYPPPGCPITGGRADVLVQPQPPGCSQGPAACGRGMGSPSPACPLQLWASWPWPTRAFSSGKPTRSISDGWVPLGTGDCPPQTRSGPPIPCFGKTIKGLFS